MSDIEKIKIKVANFEVKFTRSEASSLITTIESLQTRADKWAIKERYLTGAIAKYANENESFLKQIESQKEEITKERDYVTIKQRQLYSAMAEIESLQKEKASLAAFAKQIITAAWDGGQYDSGEIQDLGVKHGLLTQEPYDPDKHGSDLGYNFAPGDPLFVYVPFMQEIKEQITLGNGEIRIFINVDGTVQLKDDLSRIWCACGNAATNIRSENISPYQFLCDPCTKDGDQ